MGGVLCHPLFLLFLQLPHHLVPVSVAEMSMLMFALIPGDRFIWQLSKGAEKPKNGGHTWSLLVTLSLSAQMFAC